MTTSPFEDIDRSSGAPSGTFIHTSVPSAAVVWLTGQDAVVARSVGHRDTMVSVERGPVESAESYLNRIVHEIGDRDRVVILGWGSARLELERAYVAVYHRPERLVDVEPSGPIWAEEVLRRLRTLRGDEAAARH